MSGIKTYPPFKKSGTDISPVTSGDALTDTIIDGDDNTIQDLALTCTKDWDEQSFTNLLENGDFESWSAGAAVAPDGYSYIQGGAGGGVVRSTTERIGTYSAEITKSDSNDSYLLYELDDYDTFAGRDITLGVWIKSVNTVADKIWIQIYDGVAASQSYYQNSGDWEFVKITFTVAASPSYIRLYFDVNTAADAITQFDGAILVEGSVCPAFSPKPLIDDGKTLQIDSVNNQVQCDEIVEHTTDAGVTIEGIELENNEFKNGALFIGTQKIERYNYDNDAADVIINYDGYLGANTRFRDLNIYDGKHNKIAFFDGSSKITNFFGTTKTDTITEHTGDAGVTIDGIIAIDDALALPEITTPTAKANYGKIYTKTDDKLYFQDGAGNEHELSKTDSYYGSMYLNANSNATNISTQNYFVSVKEFTTGTLSGFTFDAGRRVDADIANEVDGSPQLQITCSGVHSLTTGDIVSITGANNAAHNGITVVTVVDTTNFTCDDITYVAGAGVSSAIIDEPSYLEAGTGAAGDYKVAWSINSEPAAADTYQLSVHKNSTLGSHCICEHKFANNDIHGMTCSAIGPVADGDRFSLAVKNTTGTNDITSKYGNFNIVRL